MNSMRVSCCWLSDTFSLLMVYQLSILISDGSFTENFYGLKRERTISSPPLPRTTARVPRKVSERTKLRTVDIYKSLFMLVGVPYLKAKLDDLYEIHSGGAIRFFSASPLPTEPLSTATRHQKVVFYMKRYFRIVNPYVNAGWYLAILGWHLRYLFGKTDHHNPLFKIMGMRMQRLGPHDTVFILTQG
jgi:peroxin-12